jgi:hypothetical protein
MILALLRSQFFLDLKLYNARRYLLSLSCAYVDALCNISYVLTHYSYKLPIKLNLKLISIVCQLQLRILPIIIDMSLVAISDSVKIHDIYKTINLWKIN